MRGTSWWCGLVWTARLWFNWDGLDATRKPGVANRAFRLGAASQHHQHMGVPTVVKFVSRIERQADFCRSPRRRATSAAIESRKVPPVLVTQLAKPICMESNFELGLYGDRRRTRSCHSCVCSSPAGVRDPQDRHFLGGGHAHKRCMGVRDLAGLVGRTNIRGGGRSVLVGRR